MCAFSSPDFRASFLTLVQRRIGMPENSEPDLALIVGGARSGTTLLRQLMEAHSEVGCPPEAGLPSLMAHMAQVWATVGADVSSEQIGTDPGYLPRQGVELGPKTPPQDESKASQASSPQQSQPELSEAARKWIRQSVREVMIRYCGESLKHSSFGVIRWRCSVSA